MSAAQDTRLRGSFASSASCCVHCGLPAAAGAQFCCFGCELADQIQTEASQDLSHVQGDLLFSAFLSMIIMMFSLFLYAEDVYVLQDGDGMGWLRTIYRGVSLVLATPVLVLCGHPLLKSSLKALRRGRIKMELLVLLGATAAYALSLWATLFTGGQVYFETVTAVLVLATFGRLLEAKGRHQACATVGPLVDFEGRRYEVLSGAVGEKLVAPNELVVDQSIKIPIDTPVPADVRLLDTQCDFDLSIISGESLPVALFEGDEVPAGAVPMTRAVSGVVLRPASISTVERLGALARSLQDQVSHSQRLANRLAAVLTPIVLLVASISFFWWSWFADVGEGVCVSLAVVLVSCPCTYAVATPLIQWLVVRKALRAGVIFRDASAVERLARLDAVFFDKTGTLTNSEPRLDEVRWSDPERARFLWSVILTLEEGSAHPLGRSLTRAANAQAVCPRELERFDITRGAGVIGTTKEGFGPFVLGSEAFLMSQGVAIPDSDRGLGRVFLADRGAWVASFFFGEVPRDGAADAIQALRGQGVHVAIMSGDSKERVDPFALQMGCEADAQMRAEDKVHRLSRFDGNTAMVGDGLNDAPSLAAASLGISVSNGNPVSVAVSDVTLLTDDLRTIPWVLQLARRAHRLTHRMLLRATLYNAIFIALAATGHLRPVFAGLSMLISSFLTLSSALAVNRWEDRPEVVGV